MPNIVYDALGNVIDQYEIIPTRSADFNDYGFDVVTANTPTTLITRIVADGQTIQIAGLSGWGDIDAEFIINADGSQIAGLRTSPSKLTESISYAKNKVVVGPVTITVEVTHFGSSSQKLQATLTGEVI